jgi:hypothetical protein
VPRRGRPRRSGPHPGICSRTATRRASRGPKRALLQGLMGGPDEEGRGSTRRRKDPFKGRQFTGTVILSVVRRYLRCAKEQVSAVPADDMAAQRAFVATLFGVAA